MPRVIAENTDFLVIDKPAGLITHSDGRTVEPSLAARLIEKYPYLKDVGAWTSPQGEVVPIAGLVHRLDRTTSGILVAAKNEETYWYLKNEFKERRVHKTYRALVYGTLVGSGEIVAEIMRSSTAPRHWYARACEKSDIRAAITRWKTLAPLQDATYIEAEPVTGRTHQIRVHMASIGHSLVGDHLYAPDMPPRFGFTRPALHAHSISFTLASGDTVYFEAPLPDSFSVVLKG